MNVETGQVISHEEFKQLDVVTQQKYVEVRRDLSARETTRKQIALYSLCGCGSGKKFKFCCHKKS